MSKKIALFIAAVLILGAAGYYYFYYRKQAIESETKEMTMEEAMVKLGNPEEFLLVRGDIKKIDSEKKTLNLEIESVNNFLMDEETNPFGEIITVSLTPETKIVKLRPVSDINPNMTAETIKESMMQILSLRELGVGQTATLYVSRKELEKDNNNFAVSKIVLESD